MHETPPAQRIYPRDWIIFVPIGSTLHDLLAKDDMVDILPRTRQRLNSVVTKSYTVRHASSYSRRHMGVQTPHGWLTEADYLTFMFARTY